MTSSNKRNQKIDFLRGIAILAVLILHFHLSYRLDQSALNKIFSVSFIRTIAGNGNYGVTMFFVISGFLITSTSIERYKELGRIDIVSFYIFRFARIMPCLLLALSMILLFGFVHIPIFENTSHTTSLFLAIFSVLTFWHNVLMEKIGYFNYCLNIYWSLSVEEIFYITFPILCILFKKTRFIIPCWIALIIIAPIYRSYYDHNEVVALYGYFSCFDAIAIGCCSALIAKKIQFNGWFYRIIQYSAGSLLIGVYLYSGIMQNVVVGVSLMSIGTAILLISANEKEGRNTISTNNFTIIISWFGKNSYELYLFHIIVLALMKEIYHPGSLGEYSKLLWMTLFFTISVLMAGSIAKYYSDPTNKKLREFFFSVQQQKSVLQTGKF